MSATPQRAGPSRHESTPSSAGSTRNWMSPQTPVYNGPARPSSSVLVRDDSPRSRWTEHMEQTIIHETDEDDTKRPRHPEEEEDTVRPGLGRAATTRSVRIMPAAPQFLQVPAQSYTQPESRGTTPMPMRPSSELGLITSYGKPRVPRFNAPGLDLKLVREPGLWSRILWRVGLPLRVFGPIIVQLFLDFCAVYVIVQAAAEPTFNQLSSRRNWSLAAAAYCACVLLWIVGVVIVYEVVYCFWRRWRVKRPAINAIYLSTPARHLASLASYDVFCFFRYVQRTGVEYYQDDNDYNREGAEGRAGNRSRDALSAYGTSRFGSREMLGEHKRSESGAELMVQSPTVVSGVEETRGEGMRRRSVGRNAGTDVRDLVAGIEPKEQESGHRRSMSGQTRFQELVHGPSHPKGHRRSTSLGNGRQSATGRRSGSGHRRSMSGGQPSPTDKSKTYTALAQHRRSASGRTSTEVERALDLSPIPSRRIVSTSSYSSVGYVLGCIGGLLSPHRRRDEKSEILHSAKQRLSEWCYARSQSLPTVALLVPRAGIAAAGLFAFWSPATRGIVNSARDGAFFRGDGALTGFGRGVLLANVVIALLRVILVGWALVGLWVMSGQACAGLCGPRYRWEEEEEQERWDEKNGPFRPRDKLGWEWRTAAQDRVQDAYDLCMVRRQSWPLEVVADKGKRPVLEYKSEHPDYEAGKRMDTFGSTFGAGVVKERNSDHELALSGLKEGEEIPAVAVTPPPASYDAGAVRGNGNGNGNGSGGSGGAKRGALGPDTFVPTTGLVPPTTGLVPRSTTPSAPVSLLPFPLQPQTVLQSPLVTAIRERERGVSSSSRSDGQPRQPGSGPGTSASGSTPTGPSTSTLVPLTTPRAGAARLESLSGDSVAEEEEHTGEFSQYTSSGDHSHPDASQPGDASFTLSHSGDRSYDSYAEQFSVGDYAYSQESVRIRAPPPAGSEADTSGSYSEGLDTSGSLSSLGQPISSRFFPIAFPPPTGRDSGSNNGSGRRGSAYTASHLESPHSSGLRHRSSVHDSILSHGPDSILSHSHGSTASLAQDDSLVSSQGQDDSIVSRAQDSMISSPGPSVRSGLIPPPPHNPNQRRRRAGTTPSIFSSSNESLGAYRRRVESHTARPVEFREFGDAEGFEAEREDSVGMLSAPSSRKNSLVAISQRSRRGRVSSGSGSQSGSGSGGSRAVSGAYSGSGSGSGGSVRRGSHSVHSEDEERDHTFGVGQTMWRRGGTSLRPRRSSEPPVPERAEPESPTQTRAQLAQPQSPTQTQAQTSTTSSEPFPTSNPRQSTGATSTSTYPDVSTVGSSFVTAPPSFIEGSTPTEHGSDGRSEVTWDGGRNYNAEHDWDR